MADFLWQWLKATYDPTALWASISTILITYGAWSIAERVYPAERGQPLSLAIFNLWAGLVYILLTRIGAFVGGSIAAFIIAQLWGGPLISWDLQAAAASVPGWLVYAALVPLAFLPLLTFDFFYYWFHRFQHEWPWLWHVHKLHHTDMALNVTTSSRHHWLEDFFRAILIVVPMTLLLQLKPAEAGFLTVIIGQWGSFIHSNIRLRMGPLTAMFGGPQYHRIHHSIERAHWNKNYAAFFPVWDQVFGTQHRPGPQEWPKTGIKGESSTPPASELIAGPFIGWAKTIAARLGRAKPAESQVPISMIGRQETKVVALD